jgi:Ca-activated chloride channel family protein
VPTLVRVAPRSPRWRRIVPPALLCLALAGLALALARPQTTVAVPVERASVVLVTDTSGSMAATDVEPSRLDAAKDAAGRFLDRVPDELRVGLVAFSDAPGTVLRPTTEREPVRAAIDRLRADGGTATGDALDSALRALGTRNADSAPAAVVLLSDGATQAGRDPSAVARAAANAGVPVYTVALGTADGVVESNGQPLRVPPDPEALQEIAQLSGGATFAAEDADALDEVYERLGSRIGTREEKREISAGFAAAGLLLLGSSLAASLRWRGRLP